MVHVIADGMYLRHITTELTDTQENYHERNM